MKQCLQILTNFILIWSVMVMAPLPGAAGTIQEGQSLEIKGQVRDPEGEALGGVTVRVKGNETTTVTDASGNFHIRVPDADAVLIFSYVGFRPTEERVGDRTVINVVLSEEAGALDEVVVVGYGTANRRDLTGAVVSVSAEEIEKRVPVSIAEALQGAVAGMQVVTGSGQPGESASIIVRGLSTFNDEGVGPLYVIDGVQQDNADAINPADIASIEVLKDGASAAIYGSRSANGVIIITTKQGSQARPEVRVNYLHSYNKLSHKIPQLNANEYRSLQKRQLAYAYGEGSGYVTQAVINALTAQIRDSTNYMFSFDHDYQDELFSTPAKDQVDLSFGGASEKLRYQLNAGYLNERGIMDGTSFDRLSSRLNAEYTPSSILNFSSRIYLSYRKKEGTDEADYLNAVLQRRPNSAMYYSDGSLIGLFYGMNPIALNELTNFTNYYDGTVFQSGYVQLTPDLRFTTTINASLSLAKSVYQRPSYLSADGLANIGRSTSIMNWNWNNENYLNYEKSLPSGHNFTGLLGVSAQSWKRERELYNGRLAPTDFIYTLNAFRANYLINGTYTEATANTLASAYARVGYDFESKYIVNATLRADGSSRFSKGNRFGYFPSVSAAWRLSDETFMQWTKRGEVLSDAKLRVSYGVTGNQSIGNFENILSYGIGGVYDGQSGIFAARIPADDLKWEETRQLNLGIDLSFHRNRYRLTVDLYNKATDNLLANFQIPTEWGYNFVRRNVGAIMNKGIEVDFRGDIIRRTNFNWNLAVNIARNNNTITAIADGAPYVFNNNWYISEGGRIGDWYGYRQLGIFRYDQSNAFSDSWEQLTPVFERDSDGQLLKGDDGQYLLDHYELNDQVYTGEVQKKKLPDGSTLRGGDVNWYDNPDDPEGRGIIDDKDRTIVGNAQPIFTGGFNTSFSYKQFSLFVGAYFSVGGKIYNEAKYELNRFSMVYFSTLPSVEMAKDFWMNQGDETTYPRPFNDTYLNSRALNNFYLEDASYLRIRNIRLSYDLPRDVSTRFKMRSLQLFGYVNNALTFTKYTGFDPEFAGTSALAIGMDTGRYPRKREFGLGVNVNF